MAIADRFAEFLSAARCLGVPLKAWSAKMAAALRDGHSVAPPSLFLQRGLDEFQNYSIWISKAA